MEEIKKPNDMFAAIMQTPDLTLFDLVKSNIMPENTQLLGKDFYKNNDVVKDIFKDNDGNFNEIAFDNAYNKAAETYSQLGNDQQLVKALEWDPEDFTAPLTGKHFDIRPIVTKDINPFKNSYSRTGINSIDSNDFSLRELAQAGKIYDTEKKEWSDKSANELSLFDKFFKDTLVYAQYDDDGSELDALTGQVKNHKKGDWKFDNDGNLFIEKLGNREIYGKQIVNPLDLLTVDGGVFNNVDFFDSDGKTKSITGTTAKLIVEIAPFLIPGVNTFYGSYKMAMGLAFVLPTFYKSIDAIFNGDTSSGNETPLWKAMNSSQGYLAKLNQRSTSDEGSSSFFNYEQLGGLVSDVYSQIYEQRAAAGLSKFFYKDKEAAYLAKLGETAKEDLNKLGILDTIRGIKRPDEAYRKIGAAAGSKISELSDVIKKRSNLAKSLNLTYMAMTQSEQVYADALEGGYDRRTAGAATLMSAAGQFALMFNNPLGDWFLDKTVGYTSDKAGMIKAVNKLVKDKFPQIQEGINKLATNKLEGKKLLGGTFKGIKDNIKNYINLANTSEGIGGDIVRNGVIEGIEEVSEQAVMDLSKGVVDFLSYAGVTDNKGTFGGMSNVFSEKGFQTYLSNFVGGVIGGALFEAERNVISPILSGKGISKDIQYNVIDFISNGKSKQLLEIAKEQTKQFGSNTLSPIATDINGEQIYLGAQELNQSDFLYNNIESYVNNIENILNSENINNTNEEWVRKAIVDEIKVQDMLSNNSDSFIISDVKELLDDIITYKSQIEVAQLNKQDPKDQLEKLKEAKNKLEEIQSGKKADYYYGLSLFTLNSNYHGPFISLNIQDYVKNTYNKDFTTLSKNEQDIYSARFNSIMNDESQFKNRMKTMYGEFMRQNELFSQSLADYSKDGYNVLRNATFKELMSNRDIISSALDGYKKATPEVRKQKLDVLKRIWSNIHQINNKLSGKQLNNLDLNSSIGIDFGKFLLNTGIISIGMSDKEMANTLKVDVSDLDINLQAQALFSRFEKEGKNLETLTLEDLYNIVTDPKNTSIIEEEKQMLLSSVLKNYVNNAIEIQKSINNGEQPSTDLETEKEKLGKTTIKELYKPEVFNDQDLTSLSDEEKEQLADSINSVITTMDTIDDSTIQFILDNLNQLNRNNAQKIKQSIFESEPTDIEGLTQKTDTLNKIEGKKTLRINTKQQVLNKPVFINNNMDKFYGEFLFFLKNANIKVGESSAEEVVDDLKNKGLSNNQVVNKIFNLEHGELSIDDSIDNEWDHIKKSLNDTSLDEFTQENPFSEFLVLLKNDMNEVEKKFNDNINKELDQDKDSLKEKAENQAKITGESVEEELTNIKNSIIDLKRSKTLNFSKFKELFDILRSNDLNILSNNNLTVGTNEIVKNDGHLVNNIMGKYLIFPDIYNADENQFFSPTAQLIIDFSKPIMDKGEKIDNEVIEAVQIELNKLNAITNLSVEKYKQDLITKLTAIKNYGNVQRNTLLDKLREVQINLYGDSSNSKSAFDLLKDLNEQFILSESPALFKANIVTKEYLDKALYTINAIKAIISAMTYTDTATNLKSTINLDSLYGYNVNFNKMYKKNGVNKELGILNSEENFILNKELNILEDKLLHFQILSQNNIGSTIQEQSKIEKSLINTLLKRMTDTGDPLNLLRLSHNQRFLITQEDLNASSNLNEEEKIIFLENAARNNFLNMIDENNKINDVLDSLFAPFKEDSIKNNKDYTILDNRDSILTETLQDLEAKDWYMYLHSILAGSSIDFLNLYNKYLKKEVSLSKDFRAPFYTQQFIMRQAFGYINGEQGKYIMSHSVSFIAPEIDLNLKKITDANEFAKKFIKNMGDAKGIPISFLYFIRGTSGTGKSDVLANFLLWGLTQSDQKILGNKLDIIALAPTEKTKLVLEKSLNRGKSTEFILKSNTIEKFIESLFSGDEYTSKINALKNMSELIPGEIKSTIEDTGIFTEDKMAIFSNETLDILLKDYNNVEPKVIIIDEASKINSLQYQILNYLAKNKNYYIVVLGDDLQEGTSIGPATSSLENIYMPSSVKLKSTIRAENIHKNDNNISLEFWADGVRSVKFSLNQTVPKKITLSYSIWEGNLHGDKFIEKLTKEDLLSLDKNKEILFITDSGVLDPEQESLIKSVFADQSKIKVSKPDVQGQEFDQVVILSSMEKEDELDTAKSIYTLLTRAKISSLIVGASKKIRNNFKEEFKSISAPKELDMKEVKEFLDKRSVDVINILDTLNKMNVTSKVIITPTIPSIELISSDEEFDKNNLEKADLDSSNEIEISGKINPEIKVEFNKNKEDKETTEKSFPLTSSKPLDIKVIGYSGHYNLGRDIMENPSAEYIKKWLLENKSITRLTDFAAYINNFQDELENLSDEDITKEFNKHLSKFLQSRNEIVGLIEEGANLDSSNGIISIINPLTNTKLNIDLKTDPYIRTAIDGEYSQLYGQKVNNVSLSGNQFFLTIDIDNIPITIMALSSESTATSKSNKLGDTITLKDIYKSLKTNPEKRISINLFNNVKLLTGVKSQFDENKPILISAERTNLENELKGATVVNYGVFRGPNYDLDGKLDKDSIETFMKELEKELNIYNKTPIKVIDGSTVPKSKSGQKFKNGEVPYQRYMYRPYVIVSYFKDNTKYQKMVLMYPKSRSIKEFWNELSSIDTSSELGINKRELTISKYQAWKIIEEFIDFKGKDKNSYKEVIDWLSEVFQLQSVTSKNVGTNLNVSSKFRNAMLSWDLNGSFADFVSNNKDLQFIFKGINLATINTEEIITAFNPIFYLNSYLSGKNNESDLSKAFNEFIDTSKSKIYYTTRIKSLKLTSAHGAAFGIFNEQHAENYSIGYYTEAPDMLIDLKGITKKEVIVPIAVKKTSTKTNKVIENLISIKANKTFGIYNIDDIVYSIDLNSPEYSNIASVIENNPEQQLAFNKYLVNIIENFLINNWFEDGEIISKDLALGVEDDLNTEIKKLVLTKNNETKKTSNIIPNIDVKDEGMYCKAT